MRQIGIKIFLAGGEIVSARKALVENGARFLLFSYFYMSNNRKESQFGDFFVEHYRNVEFMLDSGAFTYRQMYGLPHKAHLLDDPYDYWKRYIQFCKKYHHMLYAVAEFDIDGIVPLDVLDDWREELIRVVGDKAMPVWHSGRGEEEWRSYCRDRRYKFIGISSEYSNVGNMRRLVLQAQDAGKKVHGFAHTKVETVLKVVPFNSVDSSSWLSSQKHGQTYIFRYNKFIVLDKYDAGGKNQRRLYKQYFKDIGCDWDRIEQDDYRELRKAAVIAWKNLADRFYSMRFPRVTGTSMRDRQGNIIETGSPELATRKRDALPMPKKKIILRVKKEKAGADNAGVSSQVPSPPVVSEAGRGKAPDLPQPVRARSGPEGGPQGSLPRRPSILESIFNKPERGSDDSPTFPFQHVRITPIPEGNSQRPGNAEEVANDPEADENRVSGWEVEDVHSPRNRPTRSETVSASSGDGDSAETPIDESSGSGYDSRSEGTDRASGGGRGRADGGAPAKLPVLNPEDPMSRVEPWTEVGVVFNPADLGGGSSPTETEKGQKNPPHIPRISDIQGSDDPDDGAIEDPEEDDTEGEEDGEEWEDEDTPPTPVQAVEPLPRDGHEYPNYHFHSPVAQQVKDAPVREVVPNPVDSELAKASNYDVKRALELVKIGKFPQLGCSSCYIAQSCPKYWEGRVCAYNESFKAFPSRDLDSIEAFMEYLLDDNKARYMYARIAEQQVNKGQIDPVVSRLGEQVWRQAKELRDLKRGMKDDAIAIEGSGGGPDSILARIFPKKTESGKILNPETPKVQPPVLEAEKPKSKKASLFTEPEDIEPIK